MNSAEGDSTSGGQTIDRADTPVLAARERAWAAGGFVLVGLGILLLAIGLIGLATAGGGAALIILAIPPAGAGALALRRLAAVRTTAVSVALAYGAFALYVATAPLRGLTTPDGSNPAGPDFALLVIGAVFGLAAVLLIVGKPAGQLPGRGPSRA